MSLKDRLPEMSMPRLGRRGRAASAGDEPAGGPTAGVGAPAGQILRGYGPLAAFALLFVLMAGFVPTVTGNLGSNVPSAGSTGKFAPPGAGSNGDIESGVAGGVAGGEGQVASGTAAGGTVSTGGGSGVEVAAEPGRGTGSCAGKTKQVPGDPYSPPCIEFAGGDNGGATHRGVTAETIKVSFRVINERGFLQTLATLAGAEIVDNPPDIRRTAEAFQEFFNENYQFYGRQIEIEFFDGNGSTTTELLGGGRAEAEADAATVEAKGAFIEMNAASEPFAGALAKKGVIGFGTPYLSRDWHNQRRPYAWSIATDCTVVALAAAELTWKSLAGKPAAFAGGDLQGKSRTIAGLAPENEWYQFCAEQFRQDVADHGFPRPEQVTYKLDINSMSNQAAGVVSKFKDLGVTTILCGCDPIFPVFLSAKANEQQYKPEWIVIGTALTDWAISGQLYNQENWSRAYGISALGEPRPIRGGLGYSAYKSIRQDEPAFAVELIYGTLLMISSCLQMAGPNLNPATFEQGCLNWPGGTGPYGTWGMEPGDYTPTRDYRVVWWDPDEIAIENNQPGQYIAAFGGKRFPLGQFPTGDLPVFTE